MKKFIDHICDVCGKSYKKVGKRKRHKVCGDLYLQAQNSNIPIEKLKKIYLS